MNRDANRWIQLCGGGRCPRVFQREDGSWVVQGLIASKETTDAADPVPGEAVVELPADVVSELIERLKH